MITRKECETLLSIAVQAKGVDEVFVALNATDSIARTVAGRVMQAPQRMRNISLTVTVRKGKRYAIASGNVYDERNVHELVARAADLAIHMPDAPDSPSFQGSVSVAETPMLRERAGTSEWNKLDESFASFTGDARFTGMLLYGSMTSAESALSLASSGGLFLYQPSSLAHLQLRSYSSDGSSTGFAERYSVDRGSLRAADVFHMALENCRAWKRPMEFKPKRIITIFEPRALADMLRPMLTQFSRRAIEQDQSFLRRLDGTSFLGTQLFHEMISIRSDPYDTRIPSLPFTTDGQPVRAETWIAGGVVSKLIADRYDAAAYGTGEVAAPTNLIMDAVAPVKDLVADTEYGLLVKGFANLNILDPKNCLLSGSTRDGVFLIEKGKITKPVRNLVIRETPVYLFKEVEAVGVPELTSTTGSYFPMLLPPIRVKDVMFTQLSGLI